MHVGTLPVKCKACGTKWDAEIINGAPFAVAIASLRSINCPDCGAGSKHIVMVANRAPDLDDLPVRREG